MRLRKIFLQRREGNISRQVQRALKTTNHLAMLRIEIVFEKNILSYEIIIREYELNSNRRQKLYDSRR